MSFTGFRITEWKRHLIKMVPALALVLAVGTAKAYQPAMAEELVLDSDVVEINDSSVDVSEDVPAVEEPAVSGSQEVPSDDLSGLFVDTGEETVTRKGETLEDARIGEEPLSGSGDGGSTVNIGHLYVINGVTVRNSDFSSAHYECWTYANNMYAKIWGHNFLNLFNDTENMLRNLPDSELTLTPEHLKAYVSAAPAGAALRICDEQYLHADDGWGHSQIIISHDENGFTVFEGGLAAFPHRREAYYTWTGYCYSGWPGKYHYIKYIKWPGAPAYSEGLSGENAQDLGVPALEEIQTEAGSIVRELLELAGDLIVGNEDPKELEEWQSAIEQALQTQEMDGEGAVDAEGSDSTSEAADSVSEEDVGAVDAEGSDGTSEAADSVSEEDDGAVDAEGSDSTSEAGSGTSEAEREA